MCIRDSLQRKDPPSIPSAAPEEADGVQLPASCLFAGLQMETDVPYDAACCSVPPCPVHSCVFDCKQQVLQAGSPPHVIDPCGR
eukprot:4812249-Prorocentrum_lima.AAC.1